MRNQKYSNKREKYSWWAHQQAGHSQEISQWAFRFGSRNSQNCNLRRKKNKKDGLAFPKTVMEIPGEESKKKGTGEIFKEKNY